MEIGFNFWIDFGNLFTNMANESVTLPQLIGYTGVALLIVTYFLLQIGKIDPKGFWYSFNNLIVAILVTVSLVYTPNLPSLVIEFFWFFISLYGIIMYLKRKNG